MATLSWDMKADKSSWATDGVDTLAYAYGADGAGQTLELARRLPAVAKGGYVPPPFATVVARILDEDGNVTAEFPQYFDYYEGLPKICG